MKLTIEGTQKEITALISSLFEQTEADVEKIVAEIYANVVKAVEAMEGDNEKI